MLEVEGLTKKFGGLTAVDGVDLRVSEGEIVGLIGPNGAGKTTIFNLLSGHSMPTSGRIRFQGRDITWLRPPAARSLAGIGRTFQVVRPFGGLTVLENAMIGAFSRHPRMPAARERAESVLRWIGLWDLRDRTAQSLTLPERKRLEVARALATSPALLLLDEAMAGLNLVEISEVIPIVREYARQPGHAVIVVEHVMAAVMTLCSRIVVIHHGRKISEGTPKEVTSDPKVIEAYLGEEMLIA